MKTLRQVVLFALGISAGIAAYSLVLRGPSPIAVLANSTVDGAQTMSNQPFAGQAHAQLASYGRSSHHSGRHGHHSHRRHHPVASAMIAQVIAHAAPPVSDPQAPVSAPEAPVSPSPTYFKADGYVEKADGQLEAILIQNDGIQILKLGDRIGDHLRVTSISRDSVGAIDEAAFRGPSDQPNQIDKPSTPDFSGVSVAYSPGSASSHRAPSAGSRAQVLLALGSIR
jgi:hypothetical protein